MSEIFRIAAIAIHMLFAFGVIVLVLAHSGKDAGLSGAFGVGSGAGKLLCSLGLVCTTIILGFIL